MISRNRIRARAGFTLPEVLVAVAMVGVLSAVVMPTVIGQIGKGEISRVIQDIQSIEQSAQMFRTDLGVWPGKVEHLVTQPLADDAGFLDASGGQYTTTAVSKWNGPYLARGEVPTTGLPTGGGGTVANALTRTPWTDAGTDYFLTARVTGLSADEAAEIGRSVDGGEEATPHESGKVRYATSTSTLSFFGVPFK